MAAYNKQEHRAMELLGGLFAIGQSRHLPRLCINSLVEQIRLHSRAYRSRTCEELYEQLEVLIEKQAFSARPIWAEGIETLRRVGLAYAHVAAKKWRAAATEFQAVVASAARSKLGRLRIEALGMQAFTLDQCGERSKDVMREAIDLASVFGLHRVFQDAHPDLGLWVGSLNEKPVPLDNKVVPSKPTSISSPQLQPFKAMNNHALTPKEREVLELLAKNLSNKEIGNALEVGEETIKWHVKNLFVKLDAGSRKQVVARAQLFGLLS
jgi:LuxR family maltose regulon positive regulatory protein